MMKKYEKPVVVVNDEQMIAKLTKLVRKFELKQE